MGRDSKLADRIEDQLQADGHRTWGYVICRTTYESDADWAELLSRHRFWTTETIQHYNRQDVLDLMKWTTFDDSSLFDGADTAAVRRHFRQWAENAVGTEQPGGAVEGLAPRYRFCVQVDAESLRCVLDGPAPPDTDRQNPG